MESRRSRKRRSRSEGLALARDWRNSGLTQSAYCHRHGIGVHLLRYWTQIEERAATLEREFFVVSIDENPPAATEQSPSSNTSAEMFEAQAGEVQVRLPLSAGLQALATVVEALKRGGDK